MRIGALNNTTNVNAIKRNQVSFNGITEKLIQVARGEILESYLMGSQNFPLEKELIKVMTYAGVKAQEKLNELKHLEDRNNALERATNESLLSGKYD